jgi:hypothetical protein
MKRLAFLPVLLLSSCSSWKNYSGPTLRFSAGFEGVDIGVSIIGKRGATGAEMVEAIKRLGVFETPSAEVRPTK